MKKMTLVMTVAAGLILSSCKTGETRHEVPAIISGPAEQSRAEIRTLISRELNTPRLILADDIFSASSIVIIERKPVQTLDNQNLSGRNMGKPEHFRLVMRDEQCVLIRNSNNRQWVLKNTSCEPE